MRIVPFAACALAFVVPRAALADEEHPTLSIGAAIAYQTVTSVAVEGAVRGVFHDLRFGGIGQVGFGVVSDQAHIDVRPMVTLEYAIHRDSNVNIWLGAAAGPWLEIFNNEFQVGLNVLGTLDIAVPLGRILSLDFIVRAGAEIWGVTGGDKLNPFGQFALGLSWDFGGVRQPAAPR